MNEFLVELKQLLTKYDACFEADFDCNTDTRYVIAIINATGKPEHVAYDEALTPNALP